MSKVWPSLSLLSLLALVGCADRRESYFPLARNAEWQFAMRSEFTTGLASISVLEPTFLKGRKGWVLSGPDGRSQLAWVDGVLYASELSGTRFSPPIPLFTPVKKKVLIWKGKLSTGVNTVDGDCTTNITEAKIKVLGRQQKGYAAEMVLRYGRDELTTTSTYIRGLGIVNQENRRNGEFLSSLEYVSGP